MRNPAEHKPWNALCFTPENEAKMTALGDADNRGDFDEAERLAKEVYFCAESLMARKRAFGKEWLLENGRKLDTAELKYGKNWLDE